MTRATGDACLLALDCGTHSVRALLFDLHGRLAAQARQPLLDWVSRHEG